LPVPLAGGQVRRASKRHGSPFAALVLALRLCANVSA
jgi:hypothetical protein